MVRQHRGLIVLNVCYVQGVSAEVEILARDLLKIDRGVKKIRDTMKDPSPRDMAFFAGVDKFVSKYGAYFCTGAL